MPIVYTTGTINQPDSGSVGQAMVERMRDDIIAHAAWDLVEEFTAAAGTCRWYVLKCLAAQSGLPSDYYVVLCRTLATGEIRSFICEDYNAASHTATYFAPGGYSTQQPMDATGRFATGFILNTTPPNGTGIQPSYHNWIPSGTSTKWWITVDNDGFTVAFNGASNGFFHVGAYIPLSALPVLMPIVQYGTSGSPSSSFGFLTRNPALANITYYAAGLDAYGLGGVGSIGSQYLLGFGSDLRYNDKLQGGQRPIAEVALQVQNYNQGDSAICGFALGKNKRVRATTLSVPSGFAFGDAYVLQGRLWVPYLPTDGRVWDTGVASS